MLLFLRPTGMAGQPLLVIALVNIDIVDRFTIRLARAGEPDESGELAERAITGNGRRAGLSAAFFYVDFFSSRS